MKKELIEYFGVDDCVSKTVDVKSLQERGLKLGYIIHPDACNKDVEKYLKGKSININSTFYQTWKDITSRSRFEIFIDQMIHYFYSYQLNQSWLPNEGDIDIEVDYKSYKYIGSSNVEEVCSKCMNLLTSNIALSQSLISNITTYVCDNMKKEDIDIDSINNKEAMAYICNKLNILPKKSFDLLRYIVYSITGDSSLIKSNENLRILKNCSSKFDWTLLDESRMIELSKIFYRFKPIFLACRSKSKSCCRNTQVINKISRLAKKHHIPFHAGFLETVVGEVQPLKQVHDRLYADKPSNFKVLSLMEAIREHMLLSTNNMGKPVYMIRNGKIWFEKSFQEQPIMSPKYEYWVYLYQMFENYIITNIKDKACTVRFPKNLELSCPTSEKKFVGNIPFGSHYKMGECDNIFGIHWDDKGGGRDFDLSFICNGEKIGWNSDWDNKGVIYSGDVTYPSPEATELILMRKEIPNGFICVNDYSSNRPNPKYNLFFAQEKIDCLERNYMVNPSSVKFMTEMEMKDCNQQSIGYVIDGNIYITNISMGKSRISVTDFNAEERLLAIKRKCISTIPLKDILLKAGFKERVISRKDSPIGIDLEELNKDTLISIFK